MIGRYVSAPLVPCALLLLFANTALADVFYQICDREKTCLSQQNCAPQSGRRMFRIDTARRSVFDYVSGMTAYWSRLDDWRSSSREHASHNTESIRLYDYDYSTRRHSWEDVTAYKAPEFSTSIEIGFGDAYDWTSSFERERPQKYRYSYVIKLHDYGDGGMRLNYEYGYCNIKN